MKQKRKSVADFKPNDIDKRIFNSVDKIIDYSKDAADQGRALNLLSGWTVE
jgi:hypothetical protein